MENPFIHRILGGQPSEVILPKIDLDIASVTAEMQQQTSIMQDAYAILIKAYTETGGTECELRKLRAVIERMELNPTTHVAAPVVNVAAPEIRFDPPKIEVTVEPAKVEVAIVRDHEILQKMIIILEDTFHNFSNLFWVFTIIAAMQAGSFLLLSYLLTRPAMFH